MRVMIERELLEELIGAFEHETDKLRSRRQDKCMKAGIKMRDEFITQCRVSLVEREDA